MKKLFAITGMACGLLAPNLHAQYTFSDGVTADGKIILNQGALSYGNGGAFYANTTPSTSIGAPNLGTFQTFCLEYHEEFSPGTTYYYQINSGAVSGDGGANATDTLAGPGHSLPMDNISIGTAWLYSQFRAGNLNITTSLAAGQLQAAFWYLENEIGSTTAPTGADGSAFITQAEQNLPGGSVAHPLSLAQVEADSNGAYGVVALNVYTPNGALAQDQLGLVVVPESATVIAGALLLLPFGLSTVRILRRNRVS